MTTAEPNSPTHRHHGDQIQPVSVDPFQSPNTQRLEGLNQLGQF